MELLLTLDQTICTFSTHKHIDTWTDMYNPISATVCGSGTRILKCSSLHAL